VFAAKLRQEQSKWMRLFGWHVIVPSGQLEH